MTNKLSIVCVSGTLEKLQMASMVASVAAASGDEVTVFFSMNWRRQRKVSLAG